MESEKSFWEFCSNIDLGKYQAYYLKNAFEIPPKDAFQILVWDDQWKNKNEIVRSRIRSIFGLNHKIPARVCVINRIDKNVADGFLEENHLQGSTGSKFKYGLFLPTKYFRLLNNESLDSQSMDLLLGVMTFSSSKKYYFGADIVNSYELLRFASAKGFNVVGGFSKILRYFIKDRNPGNIMTYVDADWSNAENYIKLGFRIVDNTDPIFFELDDELARRNSKSPTNIKNGGSIKLILDNFE